ncbi:MAG: hypothetical protein AAGB15_07675 [Pseudomonadota bacterium]
MDGDQVLQKDCRDAAAEARPAPEGAAADYLPTLLQYYEEEIAGEAFFQELADRLPEQHQKEKMRLLADVEARTAAIVHPLLLRYGLTPKDTAALMTEGKGGADSVPQDWDALIGYMADKFPDYIDDFKRLEAMAPDADRPLLEQMTEHEVAAIEFLERERAGRTDATEPLTRFLSATVDAL